MISVLYIQTGYVGISYQYLIDDEEEITEQSDIDFLIDDISSYIGAYSSIQEIIEQKGVTEEQAEDYLREEIEDSLTFEKYPAKLEDLIELEIYPNSTSIDIINKIVDYKKYLERKKIIEDLEN
jgi:hypothetical protein